MLKSDTFYTGAVLHDTVSFLTWSSSSEKPGQLASIGGYFDFELLFTTVLCQTLVVFTLKSVWATMEVLTTAVSWVPDLRVLY